MSQLEEKLERKQQSVGTKAMSSWMLLQNRRDLELLEGPQTDPKKVRIRLMNCSYSYWVRIEKGRYEKVSGDA